MTLGSADRETKVHGDTEYKVLNEEEAHAVLSALPERPLNVGAEDLTFPGGRSEVLQPTN